MADLDTAQLITLRDDITLTNAGTMWDGMTLLDWWNSGQNQPLAEYYDVEASPAVVLWRPNIPNTDLTAGIIMSEFISLSQGRRDGWSVMTFPELIDATDAQIRSNFVDLFGGGQAPGTIAALTAIAQRNASRGEALYAVSAGSANNSPIFGSPITSQNIAEARLV